MIWNFGYLVQNADIFLINRQTSARGVGQVWEVTILANEQNLIIPTSEEARENGRKGGIASGKARREKRDLRKALEMLLEKDFTDKNGKTITGTEAVTAKLFEQAMKGNVKAFKTIRSTVGQDPVQKVMVAEVDQNVIDEVERAVLDGIE